jgi:hypothetical protein
MPVSGVFTSWATPAASRPMEAIFSEICNCSSSCTRLVMSSTMTIVPTVLIAESSAARSGTTAALTMSEPARTARASRDRVLPFGVSRRAARIASTNGASNTSCSSRPTASPRDTP